MGADCRELRALGLKGNCMPLPRKERPICGAREMSGATVSDRHLPFQSSRSRQSYRVVGGALILWMAKLKPSGVPGRKLQFTNPFISSPTTKTP